MSVNRKLADEFLGTRANRLGNRARTVKLLDLLTVGLNGHAGQRDFAKAVRLYLEAITDRRSSLSALTTTSRAARHCSSEV